VKTCPRCATALQLGAFFRDTTKRDGRATYCKPCQKIRHAEWRSANRGHINERCRERSKRPDVRERHRNNLREWQHRKYQTDPDYRARNLAGQAARYAANPEPKKAAAKAWSRAHPGPMIEATHRRRARIHAVRTGPVSRQRVMERDDWICWICGEKTEPEGVRARRPSLDHVIALVDGGSHTEDNLRCAHVGCNSSRFNRGRAKPRRQKVA
jgi:hypothetical protein